MAKGRGMGWLQPSVFGNTRIWQQRTVIPTLRKWRQNNQQFKTSLGYIDPIFKKLNT